MESKSQEISNQIQKPSSEEEIKNIKTSGYIPGEKSGKWEEEEHMRYVAFIDFYKEKMRSKEKRRSNEFYNQMSDFLETRNGLQCRSHHQKLEEKYVYTNKIISAFKDKFDPEDYRKLISRLRSSKSLRNSPLADKMREDSVSVENKQTKSVEVQTELSGTNVNYVNFNEQTVLMYQMQGQMPFPNSGLFLQPNFFFPQGP